MARQKHDGPSKEHQSGQEPPSDTEPLTPNAKGKAKDDGTAPSFAERFTASGRMAIDSLTAADGSGTIPSILREKQDVNHDTSGPSETPGGLWSDTQRPLASGSSSAFAQHSLRDEKSRDFEEFVNEPQSADFRDPTVSSHDANGFRTAHGVDDGAAVVDLLSQPEDDGQLLVGAYDEDLTPDAIEKLRAALFTDDHSGDPVPWDSLLNFTPHYVLNPAEAVSEAQSHLGHSETGMLWGVWTEQWKHVLTAYADQVWGDLLPLAVQARDEVSAEVSSLHDGNIPQALNRLRIILAHLQK